MRQVVLDTNVLVSGLRSRRGASFWVLSRLRSGESFEINLSVPLLLEYEEVLKRPDTCPTLSIEDVEDLLDIICAVAIPRQIHFLWRPVLTDASDDMLLELAIGAGGADIVTHNVRHFEEAEQFGIRAMTPGLFVRELRSGEK